jgi:PAS domain-containing protein
LHDLLISEGVPAHLYSDGWGPDAKSDGRARRASDLIFASAAVFYPAWHWVFTALMAAPRDPLGERLAVGAVGVLAIVLSRLVPFRRFVPHLEKMVLAALTGHYMSLVWRNDFAFPYVAGLYIVFASVGTVISKLSVAIGYSIGALAVLCALMLLRPEGKIELEVLLGLATLLIAICSGVHRMAVVRRAAMQRLLRERQLMKQIIETIPDPIFVRNTERDLVMTNEAGRQFETATGYNTEPIIRQELETLENGEPQSLDSEVATRFGQIAVSVKTARAESVNQQTMVVTVMRDITDRRALEDSLRSKIRELEKAKEQVRQLQGMLPICMHCSRIRATPDEWQTLETYVTGHTEASFTHTLCNNCLEQHYPEEGA